MSRKPTKDELSRIKEGKVTAEICEKSGKVFLCPMVAGHFIEIEGKSQFPKTDQGRADLFKAVKSLKDSI